MPQARLHYSLQNIAIPRDKPTDPYIWAPRKHVPTIKRQMKEKEGEREKRGTEKLPILHVVPCPNPLYWTNAPILQLMDA